MYTTTIIPSQKYAGSYRLGIWHGPVLLQVTECHNLATAQHLADLAEHGDRSEPESTEDNTGLTGEIVAGKFYGSYAVNVFDESGTLVNTIPCHDIRTARYYRDNPSRIS
tara:strand:+ start:115 stop:444 length:330 start_codon:yes stop_codon:yes gene_type:complete